MPIKKHYGKIGDPLGPQERKEKAAKGTARLAAYRESLGPEELEKRAEQMRVAAAKGRAVAKKKAETRAHRKEAAAARAPVQVAPEEREEMIARSQLSRQLGIEAFGSAGDRPIKLPRTSRRAEPHAFLKILQRIDDVPGALGWRGAIARPGGWVTRDQLRPDANWPPQPVLLEYAGRFERGNPEQGLWVLWTLENGDWRQLASAPATRDEWTIVLGPIAKLAMDQLPKPSEPKNLKRLQETFTKWREWLEKQLGRFPDRDEKLILIEWFHRQTESVWALLLPEYPSGGMTIEVTADPPNPEQT